MWYTTTDDNGEAGRIMQPHIDPQYTFNSARWKRGYNPDLIFVSESIAKMFWKSVMEPIPLTQHRPMCARVDLVIVAHPTPFSRPVNLQESDYNGFLVALDKIIDDVELMVLLLFATARSVFKSVKVSVVEIA